METTTISLNPLIANRRSPRAFDPTPVEEDQMYRLFDAARRAASSFNIQPWRFIYAHKETDDHFQALLDSLMEPNQIWAEHAPVLMVTLAGKYNNNGDPNAHAWHDVGLSMGNLTLQAMTEGLFIHQMGGFYPEKVRENFAISDDYDPVAVVAIGYPGNPDYLPENLKKAEENPTPRLKVEEVVSRGKWDNKPS